MAIQSNVHLCTRCTCTCCPERSPLKHVEIPYCAHCVHEVCCAQGQTDRCFEMFQLGVAVQGLSEPVGALIALLFVKPFLTPLLLQYMLAFVGGIMVSTATPAVPSDPSLCWDV